MPILGIISGHFHSLVFRYSVAISGPFSVIFAQFWPHFCQYFCLISDLFQVHFRFKQQTILGPFYVIFPLFYSFDGGNGGNNSEGKAGSNGGGGGGKSTKGASKMRRDLINTEIAHLRDLLPLPSSTRQRLSQLQLMALVLVYVRKSNYFDQGNQKNYNFDPRKRAKSK